MLVSIFVNPLQFGVGEDFDRYPRTVERDLELCAEEGVSVVFAPAGREMYPRDPRVTVDPGPVGRLLEGEFRPGFFGGVLTVVMKLLQLTRPDIAVFGEKDAQQLALIRQLAADLDLGVQIAGAPTHRDADGLATSSRNVYLSTWERAVALAIPRALAAAAQAAPAGPAAALAAAAMLLEAAGARRAAAGAGLPGPGRPADLRRGRPGLRGPGAAAGRGPGRRHPADRQHRPDLRRPARRAPARTAAGEPCC